MFGGHVKRGDQASFDLRSRNLYRRLVGRLFVNGKDLGAQLVRQGSVMAWDGFVGRCDDLDYSEFKEMAMGWSLSLVGIYTIGSSVGCDGGRR